VAARARAGLASARSDPAFAALEILELHEYEDGVREGSGHNGRSALIGLVARR
jgi:hypothetical protein